MSARFQTTGKAPAAETPERANAVKEGGAADALRDPALRFVVGELETLSRLMPPAGLQPPGDSDEAEDAFFDNMPV
ncbi:hypothetical protein [Acidimangrovimonas sediminis]|uniref:hypothetical protein n=1 Tax=Acidimangrovimonas sediminis TaxID=2056283 RepID=UPI000C80CDE7|nr:hypothetical protein [Acidimangrovimonas sediminis]